HRLFRPAIPRAGVKGGRTRSQQQRIAAVTPFDQRLNDLQHVHDDVLASIRADGVDTADAFERKMSTLSAHEMLRAKLAVLPPVGALNLWSAKGLLINSSEMWPVPDSSIADRRYFREFTSGRP